MKYTVIMDRELHLVEAESGPDGALLVEVDGVRHAVRIARAGDSPLYSLIIDDESYEVFAERRPSGYAIGVETELFDVTVRSGAPRAVEPATGEPDTTEVTVLAPMTGVVAVVRAVVGDRVVRGEVVAVIEAMKMNNEVRAPRDGTVQAVFARDGDRVEQRTPLVVIS